MLVTSKELLLDAQRNGYAIGAFNIENMEMAQAVVAAAEELHSPVILQTTPGTLKYAPPELYFANVSVLAAAASVPVVMHLDHGSCFELALRAYRAGYTSIMIDGSHSPFEENITITQAVVAACHEGGIPVEAGWVRLAVKRMIWMAEAATAILCRRRLLNLSSGPVLILWLWRLAPLTVSIREYRSWI